MDFQRKKRFTNISIALIFLFGGIEYAVILPTIWDYLRTLHAEPYFLGLGLSAFSFSGLLSGPLFGQWSDRTGHTKAIILFANVFEITGNFMYFLGVSKWLLLASRFVAGIGTGVGASIFGYLTRTTSSAERASVFAAVMACRQVGLLIGPACNLFLRFCNFKLGPFEVNRFTAPGLFMCILWGLLQLLVVFLYNDLPSSYSADSETAPLVQPNCAETAEYGSINDTEEATVPSPSQKREEDSASESSSENLNTLKEYLREEVVVVLAAQFITFFNQTALETMVTPITQRYFNFGELENSLMYFLCGVEVIAGFFFVRCLSSKISDSVILVLGLVILNASCIWCLVFLANPKGSFMLLLMEFITGVFLQVLGLPFVAVSQVSLFSKITAEKTQGFSHGLRRSIGGLATILGPLWAGGLTANLYIMLGVMMGLLTLLTVMVSLSYSKLVEPCSRHPCEDRN
ncbi:major facilitator superfamily domain-containing protein 8 isoform X1 [Microcaecilia unicolor]|uniref:Major facilitator superfamily domain-containing protein 8-like isoform X1 n=1 Tax=Microcaecilia unicolor TaxID=1415580 RepID=A0A6P7Z3J2_9AMPH|nr:major facilitator superfamily domain-containing protein 8-like isoform X1 [Microcaecilia unicolor]